MASVPAFNFSLLKVQNYRGLAVVERLQGGSGVTVGDTKVDVSA